MVLKVLQWNILYKEDPRNIAKEIKRINPDICCLQEILKDDRTNPKTDTSIVISKLTGMELFYNDSATWDTRPDKTAQGNAILSKFPFLKTNFAYLQDFKHNPSNAANEGRIYLEIEIDIRGKKMLVGTTHLSYTPGFEITDERKIEVDNLITILKQKKENFVFTGDLNSKPDSYTIKEISKYLKNAGPDFSEMTFPTKPFEYRGFTESYLTRRIDYVFTTKDIKIISAKIIDTPYSDHLPIFVEIEI